MKKISARWVPKLFTLWLHRTGPAEKIIMGIFWYKYNILLIEYLPGRATISDSYSALIMERLCCAVLEKRGGKVSDGVLLLHANAVIHKCNIVQAAIGKTCFVELNDLAYSPDIAPSDYYLFSNLNRFLRGKNFSHNDETTDPVEDYLNSFYWECFCRGLQSLHDRWQRVIVAWRSVHWINAIIIVLRSNIIIYIFNQIKIEYGNNDYKLIPISSWLGLRR